MMDCADDTDDTDEIEVDANDIVLIETVLVNKLYADMIIYNYLNQFFK